MTHRICGECGKMESVDCMVAIKNTWDDIYCIECNAKKEKENTWLDGHVKRYLENVKKELEMLEENK